MKLTQNQIILVGGVLLIAAVSWLLKNVNAARLGESLGSAAVGAVVGTASGAAGAVADAANNPNINPLHPVGTWIGGTIYDLTHW